MPLVNFSNVDFDEIKQSIKDYLRANSNFTDYDFEGSNLSSILGNHRDALVSQLIQPTLGRAAGVVVVPAAGMESMAFKVADSRNAREFGAVQWAAGECDKAGANDIPAIRAH